MKIRKRIKRTTKQYITVALICIIVIGGAAIFTSIIFTGQIRSEYQSKINKVNLKISENQRNVYVALTDILAGEFITTDNVKKTSVIASQPSEFYITSEGIGKVALVDIPKDAQIMNDMLTTDKVSSELREMEYYVVNISSNIKNNDTVDIRIIYPNGESYVVLSKKVMKGIVPETAVCFLWLNEEEILRMSAAIVDAGLYTGSKLITSKYIEPNIQTASVITYTPSVSILHLLESDPNILERCSQELNEGIRQSLENRLADSIDQDVSAVDWDVPDTYYPRKPRTDKSDNNKAITPPPSATPTPKPGTILRAENSENQASNNSNDYLFYAQQDEVKQEEAGYGE